MIEAKMRRNKISISVAILISVLGLIASIAGVILCYYAVEQILTVSNIDVSKMIRAPADYISNKRSVVVDGAHLILPGVIILLFGSITQMLALSRAMTMIHEGRTIILLEARIEELKREHKN